VRQVTDERDGGDGEQGTVSSKAPAGHGRAP
jgi:hypothetical protein